MMAEWYYVIGNERKGPVSSESIITSIKNGELNPNTLVWKQGMANWIPFAQSELGKLVTLSPPPLPTKPPQIDIVKPDIDTGNHSFNDKNICTKCGTSLEFAKSYNTKCQSSIDPTSNSNFSGNSASTAKTAINNQQKPSAVGNSSSRKVISIIILIIAIIVLCFVICKPHCEPSINQQLLQECAQSLVNKYIGIPSTANFSEIKVIDTRSSGKTSIYLVFIQMEFNNSPGAHLYNNFLVSVILNGGKEFEYSYPSAVQRCSNPPTEFEIRHAKADW
jgi:hypothetical protein